MTPLEWAVVGLAYSSLEYWLGRTEQVKAGSVLEVVLNGSKLLLNVLFLRKP